MLVIWSDLAAIIFASIPRARSTAQCAGSAAAPEGEPARGAFGSRSGSDTAATAPSTEPLLNFSSPPSPPPWPPPWPPAWPPPSPPPTAVTRTCAIACSSDRHFLYLGVGLCGSIGATAASATSLASFCIAMDRRRGDGLEKLLTPPGALLPLPLPPPPAPPEGSCAGEKPASFERRCLRSRSSL